MKHEDDDACGLPVESEYADTDADDYDENFDLTGYSD